MPEHVHLLIRPLQPLYDVTRIRAAIKRSVTKAAVSHLKVAHPRRLAAMEAAPGVYRFWQDGPGYDRNLRTPTAIRSSIEYLHANPVRRRLCETILDYEWSSARAYHGWPSQLDVDIWKPGG
jgi:putative transposase